MNQQKSLTKYFSLLKTTLLVKKKEIITFVKKYDTMWQWLCKACINKR